MGNIKNSPDPCDNITTDGSNKVDSIFLPSVFPKIEDTFRVANLEEEEIN